MKGLILDTAYHASSIVVQNDQQMLSDSIIEKRAQAKELLPKLDALLKQAKINLPDLDYLAMANGPGSFVGLRVAMSVIQSFAVVHNTPIVCFSSLCLLAQAALREHRSQKVAVCVNAFMGEMYFAEYEVRDDVMCLIGEEQLLKPEAISLPADSVVVGDGCGLLENNSFTLCDSELKTQAVDMLRLANAEIKAKKYIRLDELKPNYLRGKSAWKKP